MSIKENRFTGCLYFTSGALARKATRIAEEAFAPVGLSPSHAYLLMAVIGQPGIQPNQLSDELELTPSTITRLLDKMERKGFVEREPEGRATRIVPTEQGRDLGDRLESAWQQLQSRFVDELGDRYVEVLARMAHTASDKL